MTKKFCCASHRRRIEDTYLELWGQREWYDTSLRSVVETYYDLVKLRTRLTNRLKAAKRGSMVANQHLGYLAEQIGWCLVEEKALRGKMGHFVRVHPLHGWLLSIKGISDTLAAQFLAEFDYEKANGPRSFVKYAGLVPKEEMNWDWKGGEKRPYSKKAKRVALLAADEFVKHRTPVYRTIYDLFKARHLEEGDSKGHAHRKAMRRAARKWLIDAWVAWNDYASNSHREEEIARAEDGNEATAGDGHGSDEKAKNRDGTPAIMVTGERSSGPEKAR